MLFPNADTLSRRAQKYTYGTRGTPTTDALATGYELAGRVSGHHHGALRSGSRHNPAARLSVFGDHVLIVNSVYHPDRNFADTMLKRLGVEVEYYDPTIGGGIAALLKPNTRVVFTESPGSNTFEMQDIPAIAEAEGRRRGGYDGQHLGHAALFPPA
ncbi:MAG: PLP-dependent transferase [Verrucomicrobiota bacterium]